MPLPAHPLTIHGGCNCRAIRYRIQIPALASRPVNPSSNSAQGTTVRLPMVATDHCNDCRAATGAILPTWMCVPADMMTVSLRPAPSSASKVDRNDGPWVPALEVLKVDSAAAGTVRWYISSPARARTFCAHCGTNLTYAIFPMVQWYPDIFDVLVGTMDRAELEAEWMAPERQCWWSKGIGWVQRLSLEGLKEVPKHPTSRVREVVE
ncbi:MAG: hypothetical protein LQ351_006190 [Letrouitia transgressa]|nr:MAG: hypothetical protein LQ351_006190 [Letrouitia transgressa]